MDYQNAYRRGSRRYQAPNTGFQGSMPKATGNYYNLGNTITMERAPGGGFQITNVMGPSYAPPGVYLGGAGRLPWYLNAAVGLAGSLNPVASAFSTGWQLEGYADPYIRAWLDRLMATEGLPMARTRPEVPAGWSLPSGWSECGPINAADPIWVGQEFKGYDYTHSTNPCNLLNQTLGFGNCTLNTIGTPGTGNVVARMFRKSSTCNRIYDLAYGPSGSVGNTTDVAWRDAVAGAVGLAPQWLDALERFPTRLQSGRRVRVIGRPAVATAAGSGAVRITTGRGWPSFPGRGTKERKVALSISRGAAVVVNAVTETNDVLNALWGALPKECRTKGAKAVRKGIDIYKCWGHLDEDYFRRAIIGLIANEIGDQFYGRIGNQFRKSVQRLAGKGYYAGGRGLQMGGRYRPTVPSGLQKQAGPTFNQMVQQGVEWGVNLIW